MKMVMRMPLLAREVLELAARSVERVVHRFSRGAMGGGRFGTNDDRRPVAYGQLDSHATRLVVAASGSARRRLQRFTSRCGPRAPAIHMPK